MSLFWSENSCSYIYSPSSSSTNSTGVHRLALVEHCQCLVRELSSMVGEYWACKDSFLSSSHNNVIQFGVSLDDLSVFFKMPLDSGLWLWATRIILFHHLRSYTYTCCRLWMSCMFCFSHVVTGLACLDVLLHHQLVIENHECYLVQMLGYTFMTPMRYHHCY